MKELSSDYWDSRWQQNLTGWDIGYASPALINFAKRHIAPSAAILIPGAGNAYEAEELFRAGFNNVCVLDFSPTARDKFLKRYPKFPPSRFFCEDFFAHYGQYDFILEQTFFCALDPSLRLKYVEKMHGLLAENGKLAGLYFQFPLTEVGPPFGGSKEEYVQLFYPYFRIEELETCQDSIPPRKGKELWGTFLKNNTFDK